ncbi:MAG: hypothetical protein GXO74_12390 [Calditrichaeota bacterium]|nr:hypothetical protein [Calditrichota bacterium]
MMNLKLQWRKISRLALWIFVISLGVALRAAANPFPTITYYFEINETNWKSASVNITIENNSLNHLLCVMPGVSGAAFQPVCVSSRISKFEVTGEGMKEPTFQKVNDNSWLIYTNGNHTIIVSYRISRLQNPFLGKYVNRSYALIDNPAVFMMIRELKDFPVKVAVSVPYGWKLATGLPFAGDNFEYSALNYDQLARCPLFLAPFEEVYFTYYNQIHFVLFNKSVSGSLSEKLSRLSQKIFRCQADFLQEIPRNRYFFIFNFLTRKKTVSSQAFSNGSIMFLPRQLKPELYPNVQKEIGSAFFRHWFQSVRPSIQYSTHSANHLRNLWFWLGVADYYSSLFLVRTQEWTADYFIHHYIEQINQFLKLEDGNKTPISAVRLSGTGNELFSNFALLRLKGELLCAILDLKIRAVSQNQKSLDDIVKFIVRWSISNDRQALDLNLLEIISSVATIDFTTFFDLYVDGVIELPFADALEKAGIFVEFHPDTIPDLGNVSVANNVITDFDQSGPLALAGIKKGDKILAVNQFQLDEMIDLKTLRDSLTVGKGNELMVSREGLTLLLSLNVPGRKIQQIRPVSTEPKTDFQSAIRKSWLRETTK